MEGYFLVADILGFGAIVKNTNREELDKKIEEWINLVQDTANKHDIKQLQLISDTVFVSTDSSLEGLRKIALFSRDLLEEGVSCSLPVRGAIAHGEYCWGECLTYGEAIIKAHDLEMKQNWIGVSCDNNMPHILTDFPDFLVCYPTPKKGGPVVLHPVVLWDIPIFEKLIKYMMSGGLTRKGEVIDWSLGEKISNTITYRSYLNLVSMYNLNSSKFHGMQPMQIIDSHLDGRLKKF